MKKIFRLAPWAVLAAPLGAFAQTGINTSKITPYSTGIINLINGILVPVLMAIAFIVFLWGVYKYYIYGAESETERATGHQFVLWGVIGFVVIFSIWGLVNLVGGTLGLQFGESSPKPPTFNTSPSSSNTSNGINGVAI